MKKRSTPIDTSKYEFFAVSKHVSTSMSISVICTESNGKRIKIANRLLEEIGHPETVQLKYKNRKILISSKFSDDGIDFKISKGSIYNSGLVKAITEKFELDFSEKTSYTFRDIRIKKVKNDNGERVTAAFVNMIVE